MESDGERQRDCSRPDKEIAATVKIIEAQSQLVNVAQVLGEVLEDLDTRNASNKENREKIRLSLDSIETIGTTVQSSTNTIAPIKSVDYAVQRRSNDEKRKDRMFQDLANARRSKKKKKKKSKPNDDASNAVQSLREFVKPQPQNQLGLVPVREQPLRAAKRKAEGTLVLPPPMNRLIYTPLEAHRILSKLEGSTRAKAIEQMIDNGRILCKKAQAYKLLKKHESDAKEWWNQTGEFPF